MSDDRPHPPLPQVVPGGMARVRAAVPLLNGQPVPAGVHHDVDHPIPVRARLRWRTGTEELDTVALEWTTRLVRVRCDFQRSPAGPRGF